MTPPTAGSAPVALTAVATLSAPEAEALLASAPHEPVLVYFTTSWCGPCRVFGPRLDAYAAAHPDLPRIVRVDADEAADLTARLRVYAFPTLTLLVNGEQHWLRAGALEEQELDTLLPALATAAYALAQEPAHPGDDVAPATPRQPDTKRVTAVPHFDDPRISVWHGNDRVAPGARVELGDDDALRVVFTSDPRREPSCDIQILSEFDDGVVDAVQLRGSHLTAEHIHRLGRLTGLVALDILAAQPLPEELIAALPTLRELRFLLLDAPGADVPAIRRRLTNVMVNFDWTSPQLTEHLPAPAAAPDEPDRTLLPPVRLGDRTDALRLVLVDRPTTPASQAVRSAVGAVEDIAAGEATDAEDIEIISTYAFPQHSELLLLHKGQLLARRDTCGPHHVAELVELAARVTAAHVRPTDTDQPPRPRAEERRITLDLPDKAVAGLVPPGSARTDWVELRPREQSVLIPAGWQLRVSATADELHLLPAADIDALDLRLTDQPSALATLITWPRLTELTVMTSDVSNQVTSELAQLTALRRLTVFGQWPDGANPERTLRDALPFTVVNNDWTHPALTGAASGAAPDDRPVAAEKRSTS